MRIFFGAPFTKYLNKNQTVAKRKKELIERVISFLNRKGHKVRNAHIREDFGKKWMQPNECTSLDFIEIKDCDVFIAIPGNPPSGGVHIELGWASALNKRIILILKKRGKYSPLVHGLDTISKVEKIEFEKEEEIFKKLGQLL